MSRYASWRARLFCSVGLFVTAPVIADAEGGPAVIAIHGGAGTIRRESLSAELEKEYRGTLEQALRLGHGILLAGGSSLEAVESTVRFLEDSPLFNAGRGAVFNADAGHELDASIMDGRTLAAGAVAGVQHIQNPIHLARLVMERSPHVLLVGVGAEEFATEQGMQKVSQYYFYTERRWKSLLQEKESANGKDEKKSPAPPGGERGTVGAVALDQHGNLAAATSTGGMTNKQWGRVGDSPIIGAGTYANNATCAVSATGHGEYFIRLVVAHDIHARMTYEGLSLRQAADTVIQRELQDLGGTGGVVAVDKEGNIVMSFNTDGMYRGSIDSQGNLLVKIYKEE